MKHLIISVAILLMAANMSFAQVAINTDGSAADSSAILDVKSTTQGFLPPRLTTTQRLGINSAANGLVVYDSVVKKLFYYQGGYGWQSLINGSTGLTIPCADTFSTGTTLISLINTEGTVESLTNPSTSNTSNILYVSSNGYGDFTGGGQSNAGSFFMNNTYGVGAGVRGETNTQWSNIGAAGVWGVTSGTGGYGGYFQQSNTSGFGIAIYGESNAEGQVLVCNQKGTGDLAVFQTQGSDKARININGEGFFDGGTTNSGADLAEAFDVEGNYKDYEPGDVLEISANADRTVVKSSAPYSTLVAGVYATKPGVLLTEDSISNLKGGKVPMGVVGVIPTKVCNENGAIARGDLLVTSSKPGYAMKADINKVKPGQILGKALQAFDEEEGKIKVLVNVR